jgi:hypothetical protein
LLFGSKEEGRDYLWGVFASAIAIALFILVWILAIFCLRIAGPKKVGILSGKQVAPAKPEQSSLGQENVELNEADDAGYHDSIDAWKKKSRIRQRRLNRVRIVVLLCSLGIVVSAILMILKGVQNLAKATDTTLGGVAKAQNLTNQAIVLIDDFIDRQNETVTVFTELLSSINEICPNVNDEICANLTEEVPICDFEDIPNAEELAAILKEPQAIVLKDLLDHRKDLTEFSDVLNNVDEEVSKFQWGECYQYRVRRQCTRGYILAPTNVDPRHRHHCIFQPFMLLPSLQVFWLF